MFPVREALFGRPFVPLRRGGTRPLLGGCRPTPASTAARVGRRDLFRFRALPFPAGVVTSSLLPSPRGSPRRRPRWDCSSSNLHGEAMPHGGRGLLDLERHFAFYGAYHSNPVNVAIHALFVWPIFLTALLLLQLTAPFPHAAAVGAALYGSFYFAMDRRAGSLAALLCLLCWAASAALASALGFSTGCKVALVAQLFCWTMQFIGHGVFEKRAPALLDNLVQALLMAPFFVLLEVLEKLVGYEPYPGFRANVGKLTITARKEWQDKKAKKMS